MSQSKVIGESDSPSSSNDRSTFNLPQYGKSMKRIRRSSSESSSLESRSKDDHKQQRKINDKEPSDIQSKQSSKSLPIQSRYAESLAIVSYSSTSSSSESDSDDDHKQQRKINDKEPSNIQSKQSSKSLLIQSTPTESLHVVGSFVPSAKLRLLQTTLTNKSTVEYQRLAWEALEETINDCVNKVNTSNIPLIIRELFKNNIIRGRGLLARCIIQAQETSPIYTSVYAALVSVINSKFPQIGEFIIKRLISSFCRAYVDSNNQNCLITMKFLAHLINQNVLHEIVGLEILGLLFENSYRRNDCVELGIEFLKECGQKLSAVSPHGLNSVFSTLRDLLDESRLDQRRQSMVEVIFGVRKDQFQAYPSIPTGLDLVYEKDEYTHMITLDDHRKKEPMLDVFQFDEQYGKNERKYKKIRKIILGETSDDEYESSENSSSSNAEDDQENNVVNEEKEQTFDDEEKEKEEMIIDQTETNLVKFREIICSTIPSSVEVNGCGYELLQMNLRPGQEIELFEKILDICAQQRIYIRGFGFLAQRCSLLKKEYMQSFENMFRHQYEVLHCLETFKLRNVAKFFAHLLAANAISWKVLGCIRLTRKETTSSSRLFIRNLFFELFEHLGLLRLTRYLNDPTLKVYFTGIFPHDTEENTDFTINFFTSIGLGGLTDRLIKYVKRKR